MEWNRIEGNGIKLSKVEKMKGNKILLLCFKGKFQFVENVLTVKF